MNYARFAALLLCLLGGSACAAGTHFTEPRQIKTDALELTLIQVAPQVYVAGQPSKQDISGLAAFGVTRVINLRTEPEMSRLRKQGNDEAKQIADLGLAYVNIPAGGDAAPFSPSQVEQFAAALGVAQQRNDKVLLHCGSGRRAAHLWVAYLIREQGLSHAEASRIARQLNFWDMPIEGFLSEDLGFEPLDMSEQQP